MASPLRQLYHRFLMCLAISKQSGSIDTSLRNPPGELQVHFRGVSVLDKAPSNDSVLPFEFAEVIYQGDPIWAMFRCPCGCGDLISLSLQRIHNPTWTVEQSQAGRPTVYPSVWRNTGCCSHFWINDGRIYWCDNSGIEPWVAKPMLYSKPESGVQTQPDGERSSFRKIAFEAARLLSAFKRRYDS